ncbi:alpha/beta hydrolase fold domain-containing protein [Puia sp. P3]|uniref:alpha/beta hydrolase fold domain-containing protein n=1 Tax=Puia sp. P3 TaxID=3423952 RepID=UPI003D675B88
MDTGKIGIVGNGVGATMSVAVALMAKADGGPEFRVQILMWPAMKAEFDTASWQVFHRERLLTAERMKWMWDQYTTDEAQRREIYASPLHATPQQLKGLPPTLIQVAENDILRDEGRNLAGRWITRAWWQQRLSTMGLFTISLFLTICRSFRKRGAVFCRQPRN